MPVCDKRVGYILSGIISAAASLILLGSILLSTRGGILYFLNLESLGIYGNIIVYLLTGGVFILMFVLMSVAVKRDMFPNLNMPLRMRQCFAIGCLITVTVAAYLLYGILYRGYYVLQILPAFVLLIIALVIASVSFVALYHEKGKFNKWALYVIYTGVAVVLALTVFTPDIFYMGGLVFGSQGGVDSAFNVHHASAYIDSIYNILHGQPYIGDQTDQYGHYGLFFYLPLKLFGESVFTISIILGTLMAVSSLCLIGAVHVTLRSNYLKAFVVIAAGLCLAANTANYIYWQVLPHRIIFPSLMIFVVALYAKKGALMKKEYAIGSIISMLAILWNLESGIAAAAAWFMFIVIKYYQDNDFNIRNFARNLLLILGALALYLLVPYLIVNMYNCLVTGFDPGSLLSVRGFIGAMADPDYFVHLNSKWTFGIQPTEFMMFLFLGCIAWALVNTHILSAKGGGISSTPAIVAASMSVAGLTLLTKCINHQGGVPVEVWLFTAAVLGILVSQTIWEIKNIKEWRRFDPYSVVKVSVCSLALLGLAIMGTHATDVGRSADPMLNSNYDEFISFTKDVEKHVPKDTLAIGDGTSAIYMELGWDRQYYRFHLTDDELKELLSVNDSFFILMNARTLNILSQLDDPTEYQLIGDIFSYNGLQYGYYERKPP